jgi:cytochrome c553
MKKMIAALAFGALSMNAFASGDVAKGEALAKKYTCASCHGADYKSPIDPAYPKLAGQYPDYLVHALTAYKRGSKGWGRNNPIMVGVAAPLSDADMADIAAYLASLPSNLTSHR